MQSIEHNDPRVHQLVEEFRRDRLSRLQFLQRGTLLLGSLAAANRLLAACTLPPATESAESAPARAGDSARSAPPSARDAAQHAVAQSGGGSPGQSPSTTRGKLVSYTGPGEGYLALPLGSGPFPAVVVIQEWWGLEPHIKSVVERFAAEGFAALAPDLYHGHVATEPDEARKLAMALEQDVAIEEIQNAVNYLAGRPDVKPDRVAVIGFCMGGALALQMAVKGERVAVVAPFYGPALSAEDAVRVKVPVVGSYGERDHGIPVGVASAMADQIRAVGRPVDIKFYPAGHAFFNDTRHSYDPESAADAWHRVLAAFRRELNVS